MYSIDKLEFIVIWELKTVDDNSSLRLNEKLFVNR